MINITWEEPGKNFLFYDNNNLPVFGSLDTLERYQLVNKYNYGLPKTDFKNMLIKGDNVISLYKLQDQFKSSVKCIYIDPPFNTGKTFDHYSDALKRNEWLAMMKVRLELMRNLLSDDGALFVHIDDKEMPYLKILLDSIFDSPKLTEGKKSNYITTIIWQKKNSPQNDAKFFSDVHDYILVYAKNKKKFTLNKLDRTEIQNKRYSNKDNDPRGPWTSSDLTVKTPSDNLIYDITLPSGRIVKPASSRSWGVSKEKYRALVEDNRIWFGETGNAMPRLKRFLSEVQKGVVPKTIWTSKEVGDNTEGKKELKKVCNYDAGVFTTPKPERLIERIIKLSTNENDIVLDGFLGSGTTCAVAHKLNRKWIGLENGNQIDDICVPRLKKVIENEDNNIVTINNGWSGGGSFSYYTIR
jgi:adenine-specific DNA-methyltransferase